MSMLHQKRKKFASVLEKACKQSASSSLSDSSSVISQDLPNSSPNCNGDSAVNPWCAGTPATPYQPDSSLLNPMGWPASLLGSSDVSCSSQLSPCIDGDSWPYDSCFSCPWNPSADLEFLEADTADHMLAKAISANQQATQTSMDLLDFLDDQNHTISHLGACMDMEDQLFADADNSSLSLLSDLRCDLKSDCLKNDAWLHDPMTSDSDLDDLWMRSTLTVKTPCRKGSQSVLQPLYFCNDVTKGLSTADYFHCVADRVKKKKSIPRKDVSPDELLFRKERNRLRSKAYRLRRKMQYESMQNEVTQARQKIQEVQKENRKS
ncbi:uncharacterized protein LOC119743626 [Patiria miniata]|uniref:BZIP domain-containing protein n=1 Tax=Patiria miniata TaxID=46514 RepID=A0A914BKI0_PATMI|nr:uncharacterized protein LOC119743626 [Patiria miniata]XP_038075967.1 uncharacterized protein LOC119743626 [Patiria miniata]XP_038075968.1 uncharacterized protein LOC119743626 [Patiria miniata]XP_038075969.1 uncharacterized protein LOC119743626 [Patiria miniata]